MPPFIKEIKEILSIQDHVRTEAVEPSDRDLEPELGYGQAPVDMVDVQVVKDLVQSLGGDAVDGCKCCHPALFLCRYSGIVVTV